MSLKVLEKSLDFFAKNLGTLNIYQGDVNNNPTMLDKNVKIIGHFHV